MEKEKEESLRLAIAVSLLRSKIQNRLSSSSTSLCDAPSETDPLRCWKQKNRRSSSSTSRCGAPPSDTDALRWKQKVPSRIRFCVLGFKWLSLFVWYLVGKSNILGVSILKLGKREEERDYQTPGRSQRCWKYYYYLKLWQLVLCI